MTDNHPQNITSVLHEERSFMPPKEFQAQAKIASMAQYEDIRQKAKQDPDQFWAQKAREYLHWQKDFTRVLDWQLPHAQWFADGRLNASVNCLDRHVQAGLGSKTALIWEGEPGEERRISYAELLQDVSRCANALKQLGIQKGDRVTIYMPMVPEIVVALLACARLGAPHSVVFGGFSSEALASRNNDAKAKLIITADGSYRRGAIVPLKENVDAALLHSPTVKKVLILQRTRQPSAAPWVQGRDYDWHELMKQQSDVCAPEELDSEHPLFLLYTSGSTGQPKGILHTTGGYLLGCAMTFAEVFDHRDSDVYWCTADVGWVTGHSYVVYGP
ncbi:MAG: AMP-binding protein, partial [Pseudobdellovibrionaceae bacterium]|nr:AMP-binding protein [Pseudobdellovibrionaceae bacterium]